MQQTHTEIDGHDHNTVVCMMKRFMYIATTRLISRYGPKQQNAQFSAIFLDFQFKQCGRHRGVKATSKKEFIVAETAL